MAVHTVFGDIIKILERLSYTNSVAFVSHSSPVGGGTTLLSWPNVLRWRRSSRLAQKNCFYGDTRFRISVANVPSIKELAEQLF